jgi:glycosyltransferase involved in cell wall biosynthesis
VSGTTRVSVVVPVYNDPAGVRMTLSSLVDQTYPDDDMEVLAVDNGSTDDTRAVIESLAKAHEPVELVVEDRIQGSYAARNAGIRRAEGSIIAFLDADVTVPEDWLAASVAAMDRRDADYLACDVELAAPDGDDSLPTRFNRRSGFPIQRFISELSFAPTCCLLVRRAVFDDVGWFDDRLVSGGDLEFGNRVADSGRELHFLGEVTATHPTRSSVRALASKAARIGRGRYQLRAYYPHRYGTPLAMLLNPLTYAPPIPWRAPNAIDDWDALPRWEQFAMYLLLTVTKLARASGKLTQALAMGLGPLYSPGSDPTDVASAGLTHRTDSPEEVH